MRQRDGLVTYFGLTFVITWITAGLFFVIPWVGGGSPCPALRRRFSPLGASLILGSIWSFWQLPAFFMSHLSQAKLALPILFVGGMALSVLMTWVYQHTGGSVLVAGILMHLFSNLQEGNFSWYAGTAAVAAIVVIVVTQGRLGPMASRPALTPLQEGAR